MSVFSGPEIVNDKLALSFDAGNTKSYLPPASPPTLDFITPARMNGSSVIANIQAVTRDGYGGFTAVGYDNTVAPIFARSSNGSTWTTPVRMNGSFNPAPMVAVTCYQATGSMAAVGQESQSPFAPLFAYSNDGLTNWTTPARMGGSSVAANMIDVTVNSTGQFVAVGYDSSLAPIFARSFNGLTWTTPARMNGSSASAQMLGVAVNSSGRFVAVGYGGTPSGPVYAYSADGLTWTTPARMNGSAVTAIMTSITINSSGIFVAVGYDSSTAPVFATSPDGGLTWTTPARMNGSSVYANMQSVTVNSSGRFIAVGYDSTNAPLFATSSDGTTWTTPARMNGSSVYAQPQGVAVNSSGVFVAVGSDSSSAPIFANSITTNLAPTAWTDLSGLGNTGTLSTGAITTYNSSNGGSIVFDGTSQYVTSSFATSSGQAVTYCGWLYSTETTATYRNFVDSITARPMIWWNASGQIEFDAADYTTTTVYRNQWVHVALSKPVNSSSASYYVNGVLVGTGTQYSTPAVTPTWFNRAAAQTWKGNSSLIQVYNSALSASEIKQNFNAQRSRYAL